MDASQHLCMRLAATRLDQTSFWAAIVPQLHYRHSQGLNSEEVEGVNFERI